MQLNAALNTPVVVTEATSGEGKVALKEVTENSVTFTLEATNYSSLVANYDVNGSVLTDAPVNAGGGLFVNLPNTNGTLDLVANGLATLTVDGEAVSTVSVPAHSTVSFDVTVAVTEAGDEVLASYYTNGYWLEGFVNLVDASDVNPTLTVPYVGFKGEWDAAPILDAPVWEGGLKSFYEVATVLSGIDGEYYFKETNLETGNPDPNVIAFSPNGDGIFDDSLVLFSALRNAKEMKFNVLDSEGNHLRTLRTEYNVRKNYYDRGLNQMYNFNPARAWDGKVKGEFVADGEYLLEVQAVIDFEGAEWQSFTFPVKVDTVAPEGSASYDAETKTITASFTDDFSGISNWDVLVDGVSVLGVDENEEPVILTAGDTTYTLAELKAGQSLEVVVYDYAGNMTSTTLVEAPEVEDNDIPALHGLLPEYFGVESTNEVLVAGYATDASGISYVKVDGEEAELFEMDGEVWFEAYLNLEDGYHEVTIEAADNKGNVTNIVRRFFVDTTAATVTLNGYESHVDTSVDSLELGVEVHDNFDEIRLFVDGEEVYFNELGEPYNVDRSFHETIPVTLDLVDGVNTFEIKVVDFAGNETVEHVTITKQILNGFVQKGDDTYYYVNGVMQTKWVHVNSSWYFFNAEGKMQTGWLTDGGKKYYLHEDGKMATGWVNVSGKWYFFHKTSGAMLTGWVKDANKWYYMNTTGAMQTGWLKDANKWYYLNASGDMAIGWVKDDNKWYFLNGKGEMQTGWLWTGGKWYFMNKSGAMATGWVHDGGKWYYMNHNGAMQTGWVNINGVWYQFNKSGAWVG
ncbi:Fn3-like domain-containing protein [Bacillus tianshenii]|nr:Fn3-like domain-containing protein [Bacillus tianshenii]